MVSENTLLTGSVLVAAIFCCENGYGQSPPEVRDRHIGAVVRGDFVTGFIGTSEGDPPITWSEFAFNAFFPLTGQPDGGPLYAATFDVDTQFFAWDSTGSPLGTYEWRVTATNQFGMDRGSFLIEMTRVPDVPESGAIALMSIAMIGVLGLRGCRPGDRR